MNLLDFETKIVSNLRADKIQTGKKKNAPFIVEGEYTYPMDSKLKFDLDVLCDDLKQNDDGLIIIIAPEGSGKTVLETQIAYYVSKKMKTYWGVENVHFDGQSYIDYSLAGNKYVVNALDESRRALNKMRGMTGGNVDFMNFLSECRDQNQIHIIVLPAYSDLEQYVAIHRVKYIIQVVKKRDNKTKRLIRGTYKIIDAKTKWKLKEAWKNGYKEFPKSMIIKDNCKFEDVLCLDEKLYHKKKSDAKKERYSSNKEDKKELTEYETTILNKHLAGESYRDIASSMGNKSHVAIKKHIDKIKSYADFNVNC